MYSTTRLIRAVVVALAVSGAVQAASAENPGGPWAGPPGAAPGKYAAVNGGWDGAGRSKLAQLAILPGATHYEIFAKPALAEVAERFLVER